MKKVSAYTFDEKVKALENIKRIVSGNNIQNSYMGKEGVMYVEKPLGSNGYFQFGFELVCSKEKGKKAKYKESFFCLCKVPKLQKDIEQAIAHLKKVLYSYPTIEFYFQQEVNHTNTYTDFQNGVIYDKYHNKLKTFEAKGALMMLEKEIVLINKCTNKHNTKHFYPSVDFDFLYQQM